MLGGGGEVIRERRRPELVGQRQRQQTRKPDQPQTEGWTQPCWYWCGGGGLGHTLGPLFTQPQPQAQSGKGAPPTSLAATQGLEESTGPRDIYLLLVVQFTGGVCACVRV